MWQRLESTIWVVLQDGRLRFQAAVYANKCQASRPSRRRTHGENERQRNVQHVPMFATRALDPGGDQCARVRGASESSIRMDWLSWSRDLDLKKCPGTAAISEEPMLTAYVPSVALRIDASASYFPAHKSRT